MIRLIHFITLINLRSYIAEPAYRTAIHYVFEEHLCIWKLQLKLRWINR